MPTPITGHLLRALESLAQKGKLTVPLKPGKLPRNPLTLIKLITLAIKNEPDNVNTKYVRVTKYKKYIFKETNTTNWSSTTLTSIPGEKTRRYYQELECLPEGYDGKICDAPGIKITCNCKRFLYKWEWVLWKRGATDMVYGNGKPPLETNPKFLIGCCKHALRAMLFIKANKL